MAEAQTATAKIHDADYSLQGWNTSMRWTQPRTLPNKIYMVSLMNTGPAQSMPFISAQDVEVKATEYSWIALALTAVAITAFVVALVSAVAATFVPSQGVLVAMAASALIGFAAMRVAMWHAER